MPNDNKKSNRLREWRVGNVPNALKKTTAQDAKQKGIPEGTLIKSIVDSHYQKNPLVINPHFLED